MLPDADSDLGNDTGVEGFKNRAKLRVADGRSPRWQESVVEVWRELGGEKRPLTLSEAEGYAEKHWSQPALLATYS